MDFFHILKGVCTDPTIFRRLESISLRRILLHLVIMATMLAGFVVVSQYFRLDPWRDRIAAGLDREFGHLTSGPAGLQPSNEPGRARNVPITRRFLLSYFPGDAVDPVALKSEVYDYGIVWTPGMVVCWVRQAPERYMLIPLLAGSQLPRITVREMVQSSPGGIATFVKKYYRPMTLPLPFTSFGELLSKILVAGLALIYLMHWFQVVGAVLLFNTLFTGCYSFAGGASSTGMSFRKIFTIGFYSGLPALIVASCIVAFDLPLLDFSTVYLFGFLGYFLVIFSRIQRETLTSNWRRLKGDNDDDDE